MGFLPQEAVDHHKSVYASQNSLRSVVAPFPPQLKQAMYAAADRGLIKRGTWDGCAFNAAGEQINKHVTASTHAARAFGVSTSVVDRFIRTWDSMKGSDVRCTGLLKSALLDVGLATPMTIPGRVEEDRPRVRLQVP